MSQFAPPPQGFPPPQQGYPPQGQPQFGNPPPPQPGGFQAPPQQQMPQQQFAPPQGQPQPPMQQQQPPQQQFAPQQPMQQPPQQQQQFAPPMAPGGMTGAPVSAQQVAATQAGNVSYYGTSISTYEQEVKNQKKAEGDYHDKWPGNQDGSSSNFHFAIAPSLTTDGRFARYCQKFFIPKNFSDANAGTEVFLWPEGSLQQLGRECPLIDALVRLKQMGVAESLLDKFEPQDCFYAQGWFRDDTHMNVTRTKPIWINLKKSIYDKLSQIVGQQGRLYGDPFDPMRGWDIAVTRSGKGFNTEYSTNLVPRQWLGSPGPLHPDLQIVNEMLGQMKPLPTQFPVPSPEEVVKMEQAASRMFDHFARTAIGYQGSIPAYTPGQPNMAQMPWQHGQAPPQQQQFAPPPQGMVPGQAPGTFGQPPQMPQQAPPPQFQPPAPQQPMQQHPQQQFAPPPQGQSPPMGQPPQFGGQPPQQQYAPQGQAPGFAPQMPQQQFAPPGQQFAPPQQPGQPGMQGQRSFSEAPAGTATQPEQSQGGAVATVVATPRRTLEQAREIVSVWGMDPNWIKSVDQSGYFCTLQIPPGFDKAGAPGEWFASLVEPNYAKGPGLVGKPKPWKTETMRGLKRHINGILRSKGETPLDGEVETATAAPPKPTAEPGLPQPGDPSQQQQGWTGQPAQQQQPQQQWSPQMTQPAGPVAATATEMTGGQPPQCYFSAQNPNGSGYYVVSPGSPMMCSSCPWEDPCRMAADTFRASQQVV